MNGEGRPLAFGIHAMICSCSASSVWSGADFSKPQLSYENEHYNNRRLAQIGGETSKHGRGLWFGSTRSHSLFCGRCVGGFGGFLAAEGFSTRIRGEYRSCTTLHFISLRYIATNSKEERKEGSGAERCGSGRRIWGSGFCEISMWGFRRERELRAHDDGCPGRGSSGSSGHILFGGGMMMILFVWLWHCFGILAFWLWRLLPWSGSFGYRSCSTFPSKCRPGFKKFMECNGLLGEGSISPKNWG